MEKEKHVIKFSKTNRSSNSNNEINSERTNILVYMYNKINNTGII